MSIEFKCPSCGNEMQVADENKGKRGKCPACGQLIKVPEHSSCEMIFDSQPYFDDENLNALFEDFLDRYDKRIIGCKDFDDGVVRLEIATGSGRSQLIFLTEISEKSILMAKTSAGRNQNGEGFKDILLDLAINDKCFYPTYSVGIDKLNDGRYELNLRKMVRTKDMDEDLLFAMTIHLADVADEVEAKHYDNDVC